jgi:hypothetical protein
MDDEVGTAGTDLRDVEAELCRLPDVAAARIVADDAGRPIEVHVLAGSGKHAKQVVRDIQSVALASFGLDIDRRIISVVQLGPDGSEVEVIDRPVSPARPRISALESQTSGIRSTVRVMLALGEDEAGGYAEGTVAAAARPRLVAEATLDALKQLETAAARLGIDTAQELHVGDHHVVVITLVYADPPHQQRLVGSAIVNQSLDDAIVRAVLDATNRRLPYLTSDRAAD